MRKHARNKGSAAADVVICAAIIIFVILPVFSVILEKYLLLNKAQIIKDAVDMANISAYNAIKAAKLSEEDVEVDLEAAEKIYNELLLLNLNLDNDLLPLTGSLAEGKVYVESLVIYSDGLPVVCPDGIVVKRPSVHSTVVIPVKPSLYRQLVLSMLGREFIELKVHVDSEIPVNN